MAGTGTNAVARPATRLRAPSASSARDFVRDGIRWDRLGRIALLVTLAFVLLLYISPVTRWVAQSRTAAEHRTELRELKADNARLKARAGNLRRPDALEREARGLGMVRRGERPFVIENAGAR